MELFSKLGIDWRLLVAQVVNFAVLLFVLNRFVYRPMLDLLEKRSQKIEQGLKDAEEARKRLAQAGVQEKEMLARARREARALLEKAEEMGKRNQEKIMEDAKAEATRLLAKAGEKMEAERAQLVAEAKMEIADVVLAATEKVLNEKLSVEKDKELIHKSLQEVR
jgi:F-type H+-transporting ATPase subunit b